MSYIPFTQYTEGETDASIRGTAVMFEAAADTLRPPSSSNPFPVGIIAGAPTKGDDAAFSIGVDPVSPVGYLLDDTGTDTVDEGDVGLARMASDRIALADVRRLPRPATATRTSVTVSTTVVTLLAANANRAGATVSNDSGKRLLLALGSGASLTDYTIRMEPEAYYEVPFGYTGIITGIWDGNGGAARITELTA